MLAVCEHTLYVHVASHLIKLIIVNLQRTLQNEIQIEKCLEKFK